MGTTATGAGGSSVKLSGGVSAVAAVVVTVVLCGAGAFMAGFLT
jgi:hypothetical protein